MKYILIIFLFVFSISVQGQVDDKHEEYSDFIFESNLPEVLHDFYMQPSILKLFKINKEINPFYLRGDLNSDNRLDYALAIIDVRSGKKGILIYHTDSKKYFIVGAGNKIPDSYGDDFHWMNAWKIYDKKEVGLGVDETKKLILKSEAILAMKLESSSGIIYWDGHEYRWYQQGD